MYCIRCGKQISDGARFCGWCGADQDSAAPAPEPDRPAEAAPVRRAPAPKGKKKKNRTGAVIALVLILAVLAVGGYLLYSRVIAPRNTVRNAERLVEYLSASPLRDNQEDFRLRAGYGKYDYYEILYNQEARLKIKDYLTDLYVRGDYSAWVHSLALMEGVGPIGTYEDAHLFLERRDVEELYEQGWAVNMNSGWFSDTDNQYAVYNEYPGFLNSENFEIYVWGDYLAVRSFEYGWDLFYRGWEIRNVECAAWSSTSANQMEYLLRNGRVCGNLLILAYDAGLVYDAYYVLDTTTGDSFVVYYDF